MTVAPRPSRRPPPSWRMGLLLALLVVAAPLLVGQQVPARVVQGMGGPNDLPGTRGLEWPEQGEDGPFRWTHDASSVWLPALGYPLDVTLHVQGVRPADAPPAQLGFQAGGQALGAFTLPRSPSDVTVRLPLSALFAADPEAGFGYTINPRLDLTATTFQPPGDRRQLGAVLYRVETRNGPGPSLPAPWPLVALLLSGVLLYVAGRGLGLGLRPVLATALGWGLLLGALNAGARPWLVFYSWYFVVPPLVLWLLTPWLCGLAARSTPQPRPPDEAQAVICTPAAARRVAGAVTAAALLVLAWHLVAPLVPSTADPTDNWTWGAAFYGLLPWLVQAAGVVAVLAALVWGFGGWGFGGWGLGVGDRPTPGVTDGNPGHTELPRLEPPTPNPYPRHLWLLALVAGATLLFALLPVQYGEGDTTEFDKKIPKGAIWRERELLDFYLKARLWRLLEAWLPRPSQIYALVATLAGGVYVAGAALLGGALGRTGREAVVLAAGLLAVGNILLYFGYVESYALVQVTSLFVLWACWQYAGGRGRFGTVGALATLAPLWHGSALWWGPMVVAAWLVRAGGLPRATRWRTALREGAEGVGVGLAMVCVLGSVMLIDGYDAERLHVGIAEMGGADGHTLMPLFTLSTPYEHYAFFSWAHLGAVVQEQLLTAPLALLTLALVSILAWPGVRRLARTLPGLVPLAVGAAGMFFYSLVWNPDLGPRADWDLLSLPALPLTLLAVLLLVWLPPGRARRVALSAYLSVSAVHAAAWVAIHVLGLRA